MRPGLINRTMIAMTSSKTTKDAAKAIQPPARNPMTIASINKKVAKTWKQSEMKAVNIQSNTGRIVQMVGLWN